MLNSTLETQVLKPQLWVAHYSDYLYGYALSRINDPELAMDLVQDTFLAALQKVEGFEGKSTEKTWLTAILKYKIIDVYRKKSSGLRNAEQHHEVEEQDFFDSGDGHWNTAHRPADFVSTKDPLVEKEFENIMQQCLKKLPNLWFAVFTLKHVEDELTEQICSGLGITPTNFWVIMHRAKLNLRSCLQKNWL
ncbi:sigma-70 family RNA polymerase sigma factor [Pedobacter sandarakinus]|uniref:sigma-70 family RNA polymerase sigma factor n=1 Tax=Pedobacter sandarakinus TaxID=353156 RepID=UPI0022466F32|nr:sigma-70 family RNA polymerase sigma factor [Pedobacter sandarakinus]MCX2573186.1 sigma-70 family RNA polymerase sigma factor [Pedobacter sandarakinus]